MSADLIDALDLMIERLNAGEDIGSTLTSNPGRAQPLDPLLEMVTMLQVLRPVEMPSREALAADRNSFLANLNRLQRQSVSPGPLVRLKVWIAQQFPRDAIGPIFQQKEQRRMSALLLKATLIIGMMFGSAGGAVALADNSLPGSPLYPAKLAIEQTRMSVTSDPAEQAALHMTLAQVRVREIERVALSGEVADDAVMQRLQTHLEQALRLAAGLSDDEMLGMLTQAGQLLRAQEQELLQIQNRVTGPAQEPLRQASRLLNRARQAVEAGLQDPQAFRRGQGESGANPDCPCTDCEPNQDCGQNQNQNQNRNQNQNQPAGPSVPTTSLDGTCPDCVPAGDEHRYGPQPGQAGPGGPGGNPDCPDCVPEGDENQYGPQPDQAGPGGPGGNPDCPDCVPEGDENQYGPQPDQPGPGEPGGNTDGTCTGCEPEGDQHQNGQQPEQPGDGAGDGAPPGDGPSSGSQGDSAEDGGGQGGQQGDSSGH